MIKYSIIRLDCFAIALSAFVRVVGIRCADGSMIFVEGSGITSAADGVIVVVVVVDDVDVHLVEAHK